MTQETQKPIAIKVGDTGDVMVIGPSLQKARRQVVIYYIQIYPENSTTWRWVVRERQVPPGRWVSIGESRYTYKTYQEALESVLRVAME